jgi:hypothetical protein
MKSIVLLLHLHWLSVASRDTAVDSDRFMHCTRLYDVLEPSPRKEEWKEDGKRCAFHVSLVGDYSRLID